MIKQLSSNLIAVEVENDSKKYFINENVLCWKQGRTSAMKLAFKKGDNYDILGEISRGVITFDCFDYLDKQIDTANNYELYFANYCKKKSDNMYYEMGDKYDSFSSLLESKCCILTKSNKFVIAKKEIV